MSRSVVVFGESVFLEGLAAGLGSCPQLHVATLDVEESGIRQQFGFLEPDVIIFDLTADHPHGVIELLKQRPDLQLVGVDLNSRRTLVLSGQESVVLTMDDLTHLIAPHDETNCDVPTEMIPA